MAFISAKLKEDYMIERLSTSKLSVVYLLPRGVWVYVFTCCYARFRCFRDRVRHVLDVVVAVVFIKAPVLNSGDEDSEKLMSAVAST